MISEAVSTLQTLFHKHSFHGKGSPENIMIDDSCAQRDGLYKVWPSANVYLCIFHFLKSVWHWLCSNNNGIDKDDRQYLMKWVRKLVYSVTAKELEEEYQQTLKDVKEVKYP